MANQVPTPDQLRAGLTAEDLLPPTHDEQLLSELRAIRRAVERPTFWEQFSAALMTAFHVLSSLALLVLIIFGVGYVLFVLL